MNTADKPKANPSSQTQEQPKAASLTFGQRAVGLTFNPSGDPAVVECKQMFADCIDQMNILRGNNQDPEVKRMAAIAITEAQSAQMWAVKALTWK